MIHIDTNTYTLDSLKKELTIALFSDVHFSKNYKVTLLNEIYETIRQQKPDYICIAGDLIDSTNVLENKEKMGELYSFLKKLAQLAPTFYTFAGHDFSKQMLFHWEKCIPTDFFKTLKKIPNFYVLDNQLYQDAWIQIGAITQPYEYFKSKENMKYIQSVLEKEKKLLNSVKKDLPSIFLFHSPIAFEKNIAQPYFKNISFVFSGHMHNGMVPVFLDKIIPKNRGFIYPCKQLFPKLARGNKTFLNTRLIISGGIIKVHDCSPKILHLLNVFYKPQINIIKMKKSSEN